VGGGFLKFSVKMGCGGWAMCRCYGWWLCVGAVVDV